MKMAKKKVSDIPQAYWENVRWADAHQQELYERFKDVAPRLWVAIAGKQVVAWGTNLGRVEKEAVEKTGKPRSEIYITFLETEVFVYGTDLLALCY